MPTVLTLNMTLTLFRSNGLECIVKDYMLESPPPLGSVITVKHHGIHPNGLLYKPTYWRHLDSNMILENVVFFDYT
jgi:hypothetical protein